MDTASQAEYALPGHGGMPAESPRAARLNGVSERGSRLAPVEASTDPARQLEALHEQSYAWAYTCAFGDEDEAAEMLQESYARVLSGQARFDARASFRAFLFGVIRRVAASRRRRRRLRLTFLARWNSQAEPNHTPQPSRRMEDVERARTIDAAFSVLSHRQREVLELAFYHELSLSEIGRTLSMPVGTVRTHYARGKEKLRIALRKLRAES